MLLPYLLLLFWQPANPTDLYYLVFLRPEPTRRPLAKDEAERIQAAHMANIHSMADRGVLVAAGPFGDQPVTISGIFVFRTSSLDEARRIAAQDPTVLEKRNRVDVHPWRGPRGIGDEYFRLHKADPKTPEGMGVQPLFLISHGPSWSSEAQELKAHSGYMDRLHREGKLAMWGPTDNDADLAAIAVFNRIGDEEAQRLMADDPAVKSNVIQLEFHHWWCAEHVIPN